MLCCSRLKRDSTSITYSSLMMSVLTDSSNCSAWNAASIRLLCAASPCMPPAGWPALAGGAAGGDSGGGCGWAAVRAEVVACCSARWRSLSCSKSSTDDGGGGAVCAGCKLWPSAVSLGECNVSKSGPRACCASACLAKPEICLALQKVLIPECERVHRARVHRARTRSRRTKEVRTGVATALPAHRHARARFPAPCARAHASTAHSARAQHACARLAGDAHALTRQHTLARQKLDVMLEALATGWPSAGWRLAHLARARCANASPPPLLARPMRHPHALPALSTAVATVCSEIMMTSEMETNETMQETENTMQDARECARPASAALIRENALASEHAARKHLSKAKPPSKTCAQVADDDASLRGHRPEQVVGRSGGR